MCVCVSARIITSVSPCKGFFFVQYVRLHSNEGRGFMCVACGCVSKRGYRATFGHTFVHLWCHDRGLECVWTWPRVRAFIRKERINI